MYCCAPVTQVVPEWEEAATKEVGSETGFAPAIRLLVVAVLLLVVLVLLILLLAGAKGV